MSAFNSDPALSGLAEASDQTDQGRLSTAARSNKDEKFPVLYNKVNILERTDLLMGAGILIDHGEVFNINGHRLFRDQSLWIDFTNLLQRLFEEGEIHEFRIVDLLFDVLSLQVPVLLHLQ